MFIFLFNQFLSLMENHERKNTHRSCAGDQSEMILHFH